MEHVGILHRCMLQNEGPNTAKVLCCTEESPITKERTQDLDQVSQQIAKGRITELDRCGLTIILWHSSNSCEHRTTQDRYTSTVSH